MRRENELSVGLVGPLPPPPGGMANQTRQLSELLPHSGVAVQIVRTNAPYQPRWIAPVRGLRALFRLIPYLVRLWRCAGEVDVFHVMANSGWAWYLFAAPAVWVARLRGTPVVLNYRGGLAEEFLARRERSVRATLRHVSRLVVPSGYLRDVFGKRGIECSVVPNVVDLSRFLSRERSAGEAEVIITRNLEAIYGIDTGIRAFAKIRRALPHARLTIAGAGPERARLERLCREPALEGAVTFAGALERAGMNRLYQSADILLNPARVDNMPNALLEAMAAGVPIVSTDAGGIPYLVEHGRTGMLAPVDDAEGLASLTLAVLQSPALASRLRQAGLEEARKYAWPVVGIQLIDIYRQAIGPAAGHVVRI